jgi:signal peptidase II
MADRSFRTLLYSLALVGLLLDQSSKYAVFAWLRTVEGHTFALFQTEPEQRFFQTVKSDGDWDRRLQQRGFFLEVAFEQNDAEAVIPHVNHGALFGFLREHRTIANGLFALISLIAALAIIFWASYRSTSRDPWLCTALGLILGGTLGNLYDRLLFNGVRDFLHWNYLFDWPVFNIADCCLVVGAGLLLLQAFLSPAMGTETKPQRSSTVVMGAGSPLL